MVATVETEFARIEALMRELRQRLDVAAEVARVAARKASRLEATRKALAKRRRNG